MPLPDRYRPVGAERCAGADVGSERRREACLEFIVSEAYRPAFSLEERRIGRGVGASREVLIHQGGYLKGGRAVSDGQSGGELWR